MKGSGGGKHGAFCHIISRIHGAMRKITKAVFPVAGLGTRFLPASKSIPKELFPLIDRPLVQYAIDEARAAGIDSFIFISARGKSAMEDYFDTYPALEAMLESNEKWDLLETLKSSNIPSGNLAYVRQGEARGLGHAVACARNFIGPGESFAVILPDDVIKSDRSCLAQMVDVWEETGGNIIGMMPVEEEKISSYGIIDPENQTSEPLVRAKALIEKPKAEEAPSNLAVIGRYILNYAILERLETLQAGFGEEIQLTDAIDLEAREEGNVYGFRFEGKRYDCGSRLGFVEAMIDFALDHERLREPILAHLRKKIGAASNEL